VLVITADDYGYWPSYNRGILEAVEMGAIDSVSAMVEREFCDPRPLLESGVEVGLHIEFESRWGPRSGAPARTALRVQIDRFVDLFHRWPAYLDGHHHCHDRPELATPVFQMADAIGIPVRSVNPDHRQWLRERGIEPVIAHQKKEKARRGKFDKKTYRRRNIVERCINSLKWFRRVATRYEKLATHYLAMVTIAIIFRLLG